MCTEVKRIETEEEVRLYLSNLRYAIENGANIDFQVKRNVDENRDIRCTNKYTMATLFPDENPVEVLKRELVTLSVEEYLCTVKDLRFKNKSEMRVFGRTYNGSDDVYIKIRVELINQNVFGCPTTFVMSFHFAEKPLNKETFPYKKGR